MSEFSSGYFLSQKTQMINSICSFKTVGVKV